MPFLSISHEILSLPEGMDKRYDTTYEDVGFELGFGRGGAFRGHSHLRFVDLIFAPDGLRCTGSESLHAKTLVVVPARTFLPDIETGDFMFLKFCPDQGEVSLPDKVYEELHEQNIIACSDHATLTFSWYAHSRAKCEKVEVTLFGSELRIEIGRCRSLHIGR